MGAEGWLAEAGGGIGRRRPHSCAGFDQKCSDVAHRKEESHRIIEPLFKAVLAVESFGPFVGSCGVTSEIGNGKRSITKEQAKRLGAHFLHPPAVFI